MEKPWWSWSLQTPDQRRLPNRRLKEEEEVEEVLGHPQDRRQHVYVSRYRNDGWVMHKEIPEVEETLRVDRAAKRLVTEVQVRLA